MTTKPTIFNAFYDMLVELAIDPQPSDRDPHAYSASRQIQTALEAVRDFPLSRLPEVKAYALAQPDGRFAVLDWTKLIAKMRSMMAEPRKVQATDYQVPVAPEGAASDEAIGIWSKTLAVLEQQIPRPNFVTWLEPIQGHTVKDGVLIVIAENEYSAEMVEKRLSASVERAAEEFGIREVIVTARPYEDEPDDRANAG